MNMAALFKSKKQFALSPTFLAVIVVGLTASVALGDGCYIPERAVRKIPEISAQRAVISWKDNRETLVISSALDSESQKLGWLIPLPAVPNSIEKQSPGALKTLNYCIQPKITHDLDALRPATFLAVILGNLILGTFLFKRESLVNLLILLLIGFLLYSLLLSAGGGNAGATAKTSNLSVEKTVSVGSYEISILRATKLADLNSWLDENGFASLPPTADIIISEYISKGWVFGAIKLTRGASGANTPHPIKMEFASKDAVYPLKLTAIAGGSPEFEIYVIADERARCDKLSEEFCDRFEMTANDGWDDYETKTVYLGEKSKLSIGHPALQQLMWNDCVLTKFAGTIAANDMANDMLFTWSPYRPYRQHFYTSKGAWDSAIIFFVGIAGLWLFVSMLFFRQRIIQPKGLRWYLGKVIFPVFLLIAIVDDAVFLNVPRLAASEVTVSRGLRRFPGELQSNIEFLLQEHQVILEGSEQEITDSIMNHLHGPAENKKAMPNRIAGGELKVEDSPGNFTVEKQSDKVVIRVYDLDGSVSRIVHSLSADADNGTKK
jgi:hypothetical protein